MVTVVTITIKAILNEGRKRGSEVKFPKLANPSDHGRVNKINIEANIATAPAALAGNALSIA